MVNQTIIKNLKFLVICSTLAIPVTGNAVTLDTYKYDSAGRIETSSGVNHTASIIQNSTGAVGGTRSIELTYNSDKPGSLDSSWSPAIKPLTGITPPSFLSMNTSFTGKGSMLITYDGNNTLGINDFRGLGSVDLKDGGATGLNYDVWYDLPF